MNYERKKKNIFLEDLFEAVKILAVTDFFFFFIFSLNLLDFIFCFLSDELIIKRAF